MERIVKKLRERWPEVEFVRGDSGFCRDEIMSWCEQNEKMNYVFGLAKTSVNKEIKARWPGASDSHSTQRRHG